MCLTAAGEVTLIYRDLANVSIDLHIHSTFSDGSMTPTQLVQYARKKGLSAIAITDHDAIDGIDEACDAGKRLGVSVVPGIELSVKQCGLTLHLLGYLFDRTQPEFLEALRKLQEGRVERNHKILHILHRQGIAIQFSELLQISGQGQSGRPHIAQLLIRKNVVHSMDEAFNKYLGQGGSAYVPRFVFPAAEAISLIHKAGGLAVLAHPQQLEKMGGNCSEVIADLSRQGLDGIEVYYPTHSRQYRKILLGLAQKYNVLATGGSDYHGAIRPGSTLAGGRNCSVPDDLLVLMEQRCEKGRQDCKTDITG